MLYEKRKKAAISGYLVALVAAGCQVKLLVANFSHSRTVKINASGTGSSPVYTVEWFATSSSL